MLTKPQYKFLKSLLKKDIQCDNLTKEKQDILEYLQNRKLVEFYNVCPPEDYMETSAKRFCKISEYGKVEILLCKQERFHFWIPTIISIIALIVSIFSISIMPIIMTYVRDFLLVFVNS